MTKKLAIISDHIVTPNGVISGCLIVKDGKITEIDEFLPGDFDGEIEMAKDLFIMPGLIDPHVHINEPGRTQWEGFETATTAAAASGITLLVDMPLNSSPVTTNVTNFKLKLEAAKDKLNVNVGFWGGVIPGNRNELDDLLKSGVLGLKAFLTHSGIDDFPNTEKADLKNALQIIKKYNRPLLVHCELTEDHPGIAEHKNNPNDYMSYLRSRPKEWENKAIAMMIDLCRETEAHVHIVHLSSAEALPMIAEAKAEGLNLTVETAQHYLTLNAEDIPNGETIYKCAPPIRERENNNKLWDALKSGLIDFVATDHSPAPPDLKEISSGDLSKAWGGIAGLQFALCSLWTEAKRRNFSVEDIAKWLSASPADFLGLSNKGKLENGADADFFIWDPNGTTTFSSEEIHHRHKVSPYSGKPFAGKVHKTFINGELIYENNKLINANKGTVLLGNF
ncbi:MAG: allantoinase AllB [Bacteroidetes bacterium]|nr:allantoinase AllB [Bacteroidota bacterium]MBK7571410.1 allantoinase AllB [Bacteroidota bacterium]MBP9789292.1 allantoinase AllB [Bacteroidia bacterium]